jgi:hypothetical protein
MISNISVLNTIQDNALDVFVDANGFLNVTGCPAVKATSPMVKTIAAVNATAGIVTVTFTAVNNYTYNFRVTGYDSSNNLITLPFSYTTAATGSTATTIATAIAALISKSAIGAKFASVVGGATLVLTGTSLNPLISFDNYTGDTSIVISAVGSGTTLGVEAQGYGADLLVAYGGFIGSSAIVSTGSYDQYEITVNPPIMFGGQSITEVGSTTYVVLVNKAATTAGSNPVALNLSLLTGADDLGVAKTMGTITGLGRGLRVVVQAPATTTAAVAVTAQFGAASSGGAVTSAILPTVGSIALSGGSATFTTLAARQGDIILISASGGTAFTTNVKTTLMGITGAQAATGDYVTTVTAAVFKTIGIRNIPN